MDESTKQCQTRDISGVRLFTVEELCGPGIGSKWDQGTRRDPTQPLNITLTLIKLIMTRREKKTNDPEIEIGDIGDLLTPKVGWHSINSASTCWFCRGLV